MIFYTCLESRCSRVQSMSVYYTVQELKVIRIFVTTRVYSSNKIIKSYQKVIKNYQKKYQKLSKNYQKKIKKL